MPPILAFQSVADATVSTPAVIDALFRRLAPQGHALVLFDINRYAAAAELFAPSALAVKEHLLGGPPLPFDLTVLANADGGSVALDAFERRAGAPDSARVSTGLSWPRGVYSLSHVALPFAPQDPVYGANPPAVEKLLYLGKRGEPAAAALAPRLSAKSDAIVEQRPGQGSTTR